ncbi:Glycogen debranching enzyme [Streptomyces badius]
MGAGAGAAPATAWSGVAASGCAAAGTVRGRGPAGTRRSSLLDFVRSVHVPWAASGPVVRGVRSCPWSWPDLEHVADHRPRRPELGPGRPQGRGRRTPPTGWRFARPDDRRGLTFVIYEPHVRARRPSCIRTSRASCAARTPVSRTRSAIEHLTRLGVTAVELLPVHQFAHEDHLLRRGLRNHWGYNSIGYFAPHAGYSASGTAGQQVGEFERMVRALHDAGIEVILDVVYNHTAEAGELGPMLSLRGIDNRGYYRLEGDPRRYADYTGCGNTLHVVQPQVLRLDHRLAALLGHRDGRRRLPLRPGGGAGPLDARRRHALPFPRGDRPGPRAAPGQTDRRAVGRRQRRLPGRGVPSAVDRVERPVPRRRARLLAGRAPRRTGSRLPADRLQRPVRLGRAPSVRIGQLRHRARRLHPARPGLLRAEAQRGERGGQPGRDERQPGVELRGGGRERRSADQRAAPPSAPQSADHAAALHRGADAGGGRRDGPHPGREQQRLLPGQRDRVGRLVAAGPAAVAGAGRADGPGADAAPDPPGAAPPRVLLRPGAGPGRAAGSGVVRPGRPGDDGGRLVRPRRHARPLPLGPGHSGAGRTGRAGVRRQLPGRPARGRGADVLRPSRGAVGRRVRTGPGHLAGGSGRRPGHAAGRRYGDDGAGPVGAAAAGGGAAGRGRSSRGCPGRSRRRRPRPGPWLPAWRRHG